MEIVASSARVEGGSVDDTTTQVFRVLVRLTSFAELCSATLIAPQLMLTARHCVAPTPQGHVDCATDRFGETVAPTELKFSNSVEPDLSSRWFGAKGVIVSPDSDLTCGYDIAVVVLDEPVPPEVAVPAEPRFAPQIRSGERYRAVGYGGNDANEDTAVYGIRHSRSDLSVACGQENNCEAGAVAAQEFVGTEGACHGDSGGPAIDGDNKVIGVLSRGADGCASPIYVGVPAFEALLVDAAQQANEQWGAPLPVWAGGDPAPTTPSASTSAESATPPESAGDETSDETTTAREGAGDDNSSNSARPTTTLAKEGCSVSPAVTSRAAGVGARSPWMWLLAPLAGTLGWRRRRVARRRNP